MSEPLCLAIVGAGRIAQAHAQALRTSTKVRLCAVADVDAAAAAALAEPFGCPSFGSYEALADQTDIEAVLVCTPPNIHADVARFFMERGVHVICEKPLTLDTASAIALYETAKAHGVHLTMASKFRFVTDIVRAKSMVASGMLGEVFLFENCFSGKVDMSGRWNSDRSVSGGGVLIDNGTHSVDIMRFFLGELAEVHVAEGPRIAGLDVDETVTLTARSASGVLARADLTWSANMQRDDFVRIHGSEGVLSVGWGASKFKLANSRDWVVFGDGYDKLESLRGIAENFAGVVRGTEAPRMDAEDSYASVAVIEAAYRALRNGTWEGVGETGTVRQPVRVVASDGVPPRVRIHETALIEPGVEIGDGTAIWDNVHVRRDTAIGRDCIIGEKSHISYGIRIGDRVKINAFVYTCHGLTIEDGVMIAAGTTFTNDLLPRATTPDLSALRSSDPDAHTRQTVVREGATIGAGCTIGSDLELGRFAMVGMGSVVTRSVPDFHLALGNPARSVGCVCRCGQVLERFESPVAEATPRDVTCAACNRVYTLEGQQVSEQDAAA